MTRVDKSPEQLNAEAAAGTRDLRSFSDLIEEARAAYRGDLTFKPVTSRVPSDPEPMDVAQYDAATMTYMPGSETIDVVDAGELGGYALTQRMVRLLEGHYREFPWMKALHALRDKCRKEHPEHLDRNEFRGSLCYRLAYLVVVTGRSPGEACLELGIGGDKARRNLRTSLLWIERAEDEYRRRAQQRETGFSEGIESVERHGLPGLHSQDCPRCRRETAA